MKFYILRHILNISNSVRLDLINSEIMKHLLYKVARMRYTNFYFFPLRVDSQCCVFSTCVYVRSAQNT